MLENTRHEADNKEKESVRKKREGRRKSISTAKVHSVKSENKNHKKRDERCRPEKEGAEELFKKGELKREATGAGGKVGGGRESRNIGSTEGDNTLLGEKRR